MKNPPFHAEHIGSFVRPQRLIEAARARKNRCSFRRARFRQVQDDCIREIVAFQEVDRPAERHRRRIPPAQLVGRLHRCGRGLRPARRHARLPQRERRHRRRLVALCQGAAQAQASHRRRRLPLPEGVVKRGVPKVTIAAPDVMHWFLGPKAFETSVYRDREAFFADLVRDLPARRSPSSPKEGCTYLQLDDTALPCNCDPNARNDVVARGENPDELTERYAKLFNDAIAEKPADMTIGIHLCRGNLKGAWMAEGGYEPVADALFNRLNADVYCLEYDTQRAGDFSPLRYVPKGKTRDPRPRLDEDAGARKQGCAQAPHRRGGEVRAARAAWAFAAMRLLERRRRRPDRDQDDTRASSSSCCRSRARSGERPRQSFQCLQAARRSRPACAAARAVRRCRAAARATTRCRRP